MMIDGPKEAVDHLDPIFSALAPGLGRIARTSDREKGGLGPIWSPTWKKSNKIFQSV